MSKKVVKLNVQGSDITIITDTENEENDYICLTDIANKFGDTRIIDNWLRNRSTIEFLGFWESLHNSNDFNSIEFEGIKNEAGSNRFVMSVKKWVQKTNAIGISAKTGKYNSGTYAHKDIAMAFCSWISPEFQLFIIKEFQRLKKEEAQKNNEIAEWDSNRWLTKVNYKIQTDAIKENIIPVEKLPKSKEYIVYSSEADLLNIAVFGMKAQEFAKLHPDVTKKNKNIRDVASKLALNIVNNLQSANAKMIRDGISKEKRANELIIQASEEKKSLGLNTQESLYRYDLFMQQILPQKQIENKQSIEAPVDFTNAIQKTITKPKK